MQEDATEEEKKGLKQKFYEFQRSGLISYRKYLKDQWEYSSKISIRKAYTKYIEDQLKMNEEKIAEIDKKLG